MNDLAVLPPMTVDVDRAGYVKTRLLSINAQANDIVIENGILLKEYKENGYYREDGYKTFDDAIQAMQDKGQLDYGPRNARNFIAIADMMANLNLLPENVEAIGVSKLREIATLPVVEDKRKLLETATEMSVGEVQREAKRLRDKALGRESDPLVPVILKTTESQHEFFRECISEARRIYSLSENMSDASVLIDAILAEWHSEKDHREAEQIEAMQ
jgi:hypothetical protein